MPRIATGGVIGPLALDRRAAPPLYRQLYEDLRALILNGRLAAGGKLPSTRLLAAEHGVSRNTVLQAFDQLMSEGYIKGRRGAGSYVSRDLPHRPARTAAPAKDLRPLRSISARGRAIAAVQRRREPAPVAFAPGLPDVSAFPAALWSRLVARSWRQLPLADYAVGDRAGHLPLRAAIAEYLNAERAVRCGAEQVLILSGIRQAIDLCLRVLADSGDAVWMEEPGYHGVRATLTAAGCRAVPVPVDGEGLSVAAGIRLAPRPKLICVSPSHQYPLGITMSLTRRLELLAYAKRVRAWVLEDDYDSEFRYSGRPLAALQGLDDGGGVLYAGSFAKAMFPALRLGYLVVPLPLLESFRRARAALDDYPGPGLQPALAAFMQGGYFGSHIRQMRRRYAARQAALVAAVRTHLAGMLEVEPDPAGLHLIGRLTSSLRTRSTDLELEGIAADAGVAALALSRFYAKRPAQQGLLLGYAAFDEATIDRAAQWLGTALNTAPEAARSRQKRHSG
jgi:GntR family transcriptional regulator/MocR family aminotransferase